MKDYYTGSKRGCLLNAVKALLVIIAFLTNFDTAFAEGSVNLYPNGVSGYRACVQSRSGSPVGYDPFPTLGTMKVYVKAGEKLYVGSSAQGLNYNNTGTINLRSPNGATYSSGTTIVAAGTNTPGRIVNRTQELAGPYYSATIRPTGYQPYTHLVTAAEEGIWEIDFVPPSDPAAGGVTGYDVLANADWTQPVYANGAMIAAFDISVGSATDASSLIPGRVYCNNLNLNIPQNTTKGVYSNLYVLTNVGYVYRLNTNGLNGGGYCIFSNNKGIQTGGSQLGVFWKDGDPLYQSAAYTTPATLTPVKIYDPRLIDNGIEDVTHKLFFDKPDINMPTTANSVAGTTWLINPVTLPSITDLNLVGKESGVTGVIGPDGANISFISNVAGKYTIGLSATGYTTRTLTGDCVLGTNLVAWDGKDGASIPQAITSGTSITVAGSISAGEVHFPLADVEYNNNGIKLELLKPDYTSYSPVKDVIYWHDSNLTSGNDSPNGTASSAGAHKWPTATFGDQNIIDTWSYVLSDGNTVSVAASVEKLDLAVISMTATPTSVCVGAAVNYTVTTSNLNTNASYVDATGATFGFVGPAGYVITSATLTPSAGVSETGRTGLNSNKFTSTLNIVKGAVATYTITGYTNTAGTVLPYAYILRPADVIEVDLLAVNPVGVPSDPFAEYGCSAATVSSCAVNNVRTLPSIVTVNSLPTITTSADVAIYLGNSTTLTAAGGTSYTWSPAAGLNATTGSPVTATPVVTTTYTLTGTDGNNCSNTANVSVTVIPSSDIKVEKSFLPSSVKVGDQITFTIKATNIGPSPATGVTIKDVLPTGYTYVSNSGAGTYDTGSSVWTINSLALNATATLTITATVK